MMAEIEILLKINIQHFNGIQTHGPCFSTAALYQLSYEDPDQFVKLIITYERNETKNEDDVICRNTNLIYNFLNFISNLTCNSL